MMSFLKQFFNACHCQIISHDDQSITVELTEEADRAFMNRPFYWYYKDRLNEKGVPMTISFFVKNTGKSFRPPEEYINFGSPRFHQLLDYAKKQSSFVRLYEQCSSVKPMKLEPWLFVHFLVSYEANGKKERIESLAIHLISGVIYRDFLSKISELPFDHTIPSFHYVLSPFITPVSGLKRLRQLLENELEQEDNDWSIQAKEKQEKELELLHSFYEDSEKDNELYQKEKEAIMRRFEPAIRLSILNGGLFYLSSDHFHSFKNAQSFS
ncbi:YqhG family protein [Domibacillus epiphyticus]|uniref:Uncharacterized protein n=1 Tax=Domibacillus epiphyticus TaxID=1714355 RepID=A0A1V2A9N0_9BACI|nr:YqhG family protein [Domibacillus epiphyticus]OMP67691.1 hypothetical protein BTO28_07045 [Domibacillus epiphyticus]